MNFVTPKESRQPVRELCKPGHLTHKEQAKVERSRTGVRNLLAANYPRVIKQSTRTLRLAGKTVDFTLLHHNNARLGKIYAEFSVGTHFPPV